MLLSALVIKTTCEFMTPPRLIYKPCTSGMGLRPKLCGRLTIISFDVDVAHLKDTLLRSKSCFTGMGAAMELRHLRYFIAVAEAGSLTVAAKQRLHTSQPSLSRQIRDLEKQVGARLLTRRARGIELTPAGRAFLDHARLVLSQVEAGAEAARRVAQPAKPCFRMGFLTGHELTWMPEALRILRDELPNIDVMISSQYSPLLAQGLSKGKIEAAFLRREEGVPDVAFRLLVKEPLMVVLPSDHRLAALKSIAPRDLLGEPFITVSDTAPVLRVVIDNYLKRSGTNIKPAHEADHLAMGMSLIASTGGVGLLPAYAHNFLPSSVTSRPLKGDAPTIDLVLGYKKSNDSPILKLLLSRVDDLVARVSKKPR
jgi:LysR family transcriptional regulator, hca operon transcriptional activator